MTSVEHHFHDLDGAIDSIHGLFRQWDERRSFYPPLDAMALERAKLAVHEWMANLIQHADFAGQDAAVCISLATTDRRVKCIIEDNSRGFDLEGQLFPSESLFNDLPEAFPERGMGLMLVIAIAEDLSYTTIEGGRHSLKFFVSS